MFLELLTIFKAPWYHSPEDYRLKYDSFNNGFFVTALSFALGFQSIDNQLSFTIVEHKKLSYDKENKCHEAYMLH
jgi:hypothetical protein